MAADLCEECVQVIANKKARKAVLVNDIKKYRRDYHRTVFKKFAALGGLQRRVYYQIKLHLMDMTQSPNEYISTFGECMYEMFPFFFFATGFFWFLFALLFLHPWLFAAVFVGYVVCMFRDNAFAGRIVDSCFCEELDHAQAELDVLEEWFRSHTR